MNKVGQNRYVSGGYVDVPFARDLETMGDELCNRLTHLMENIDPPSDPQSEQWWRDTKIEIARWRDYNPGQR